MINSLNKYDNFLNKFRNQKQIENEIFRIYEEEYNELFENILIKEESIFIQNLSKNVKLTLIELFSETVLENEKIISSINLMERHFYKNMYLYDREKLLKTLKYKGKFFIENGQNFSFLKHCSYQKNEPNHICNKKNNFIIVLDTDYKADLKGIKNIHRKGSSTEYNIIYAIICTNCLKSYKSNYIKLFCNFCSIPYYTRIITSNEIYNNNLQPATWDKYHCHLIINQQMNCIKCQSPLFLDLKEGKLICKNCNFCDEPYNINWTCIKCGENFNSNAKIYNPYEFKPFSNAIKKGIFEKKSALPDKIPCGHNPNLIIHNNNCDGKLYFTELNGIQMVLCGKCKVMIKYQKFIFECVECGKKYRKKDIEDFFNGQNLNNGNLDYNIKKNIYNFNEYNNNINNEKNKDIKRFSTKNFYSPRPNAGILNRFNFFNNEILHNIIKSRSREKLSELDKEIIDNKEEKKEDKSKENTNKELNLMKTINILKSKRSFSSNKKDLKTISDNNQPKLLSKFKKKMSVKSKEEEYFSSSSEENDKPKYQLIKRKESQSLDKLLKIRKLSSINQKKSETIIKKIPSAQLNEEETIYLPIFDVTNYEIISQIGTGRKSKIFCVKLLDDNIFYAMKKKVLKDNKKEMDNLIFSYALQYSLMNNYYITHIYGINFSKDEFSVLEEIGINSWESEIATMKKMGKFYSEEDLINIIYQISLSLETLEKRNLCHFNINPQNILVFKDKIYKLTDLEYIQFINEKNLINNNNNYISPQLFNYYHNKDKDNVFVDLIKNDVYSLGLCIIYTMTKTDDYFNNIFNNFVSFNINNNDHLIDGYLKYPMSNMNSVDCYDKKFIYLLKQMLNRNEEKRFNFTQINTYIRKEYEFEH
jgi:hypothetical protein